LKDELKKNGKVGKGVRMRGRGGGGSEKGAEDERGKVGRTPSHHPAPLAPMTLRSRSRSPSSASLSSPVVPSSTRPLSTAPPSPAAGCPSPTVCARSRPHPRTGRPHRKARQGPLVDVRYANSRPSPSGVSGSASRRGGALPSSSTRSAKTPPPMLSQSLSPPKRPRIWRREETHHIKQLIAILQRRGLRCAGDAGEVLLEDLAVGDGRGGDEGG
jgi:hypothetical protein